MQGTAGGSAAAAAASAAAAAAAEAAAAAATAAASATTDDAADAAAATAKPPACRLHAALMTPACKHVTDAAKAEMRPPRNCRTVVEVRLGKSPKRLAGWIAQHRRTQRLAGKSNIKGAKVLWYRTDSQVCKQAASKQAGSTRPFHPHHLSPS